MKQLEVKLRVRNNLLVARRLEMGLKTQTDAARAIGMAVTDYNGFECLRTSPVSKRGGWTPAAWRIANFHGVSPTDLWPDAILEIKQPVLTVYADSAELMPGTPPLALPADRTADANELHDTIMAVLDPLPPRDREMLLLYFGIHTDGSSGVEMTYEEIAPLFDVTNARVAQIVQRALSRVRNSNAREDLKLWHEEDLGEMDDHKPEQALA